MTCNEKISKIKTNMYQDFYADNEERTKDEIHRNNKKIIKFYEKRIFNTEVFRIALYISSILFFIIYYGLLGSVILWELIQDNKFGPGIIILYYIIYGIIWSIKIYFRFRT